MKRLVICLLLLATPAASQTVEQRLGATIAALIVENARLATELEAAKQMIVKLQAKQEEKP